jgi:DNA (cytosine-5)-methyltransferase 1
VTPSAYYNEIDPYAAQWLRNLIAAGHIAPGEVDERSILDVSPDDLAGFTQCHFFAGIGVWSYALRRGGWLDSSPVWTGSCPCQPFSVAGVGSGFDDERHLWPFWFHLIEQRRPCVVFGEQVEAAIRHGWLDVVQADMEGIGYAFAAAGVPAAGVGAPHIRQRLWFVAESWGQRWKRGQGAEDWHVHDRPDAGRQQGHRGASGIHQDGGFTLADTASAGRGFVGRRGSPGEGYEGPHADQHNQRYSAGAMGDASAPGLSACKCQDLCGEGRREEGRAVEQPSGSFWANADWLECRDGKWRPVEPGTFPLAHGATARVGRLRAYGNAINAENAREFVAAYMECRP